MLILLKYNNYIQSNIEYNENIILNDINIEIMKGQTVAIVGKSGSGKTTFSDVDGQGQKKKDQGAYNQNPSVRADFNAKPKEVQYFSSKSLI